jgi:hypothetical protein
MAPDTMDFGYNGQNSAVCNCEFLETLMHTEGSVVRKLFKIKRTPR